MRLSQRLAFNTPVAVIAAVAIATCDGRFAAALVCALCIANLIGYAEGRTRGGWNA